VLSYLATYRPQRKKAKDNSRITTCIRLHTVPSRGAIHGSHQLKLTLQEQHNSEIAVSRIQPQAHEAGREDFLYLAGANKLELFRRCVVFTSLKSDFRLWPLYIFDKCSFATRKL